MSRRTGGTHITGQNGHDWKATTPVLRKILEDTGRFEVRVTEEFRGAGPETLSPYDVVILNYYEKKQPDLGWGERADAALENYVRGGKGLVVYHFAMAAFDGWTEYEKMCGANWRPERTYHVLATAWDDHSRYRPGEKQPIPGAALNQPMLWTVNYGNGRVFVTALGHDPAAMRSDGFAAMLSRGAEWAATGNVTTPLPDDLRQK